MSPEEEAEPGGLELTEEEPSPEGAEPTGRQGEKLILTCKINTFTINTGELRVNRCLTNCCCDLLSVRPWRILGRRRGADGGLWLLLEMEEWQL